MSATHKFRVEMTCTGCTSAVQKVLEKNKAKGIDSFDINLDEKMVSITGNVSQEDAKTILEKTGKKVEILG